MRRSYLGFDNFGGSVREGNQGFIGTIFGHGCALWVESAGMARGGKQRRLGFFFLGLLLFLFASLSYAAPEEASSVAGRHAGGEKARLGLRDASPCDSAAETWPEGHLKQWIASEASDDGASDVATGPCIRQTEKPVSCPVKCFRADPVCGTDKVTYWCGVADAKCAGVEVAHDGYCKLWELDTNVGSTMAIRAVQSLQLVHILWLAVAGLLVVLGSV